MDNQTILITGAGKGIGKEIAKKFYKKGFNIAVNHRSDLDFQAYLDDIGASSEKVMFVKADVSVYEEVEGMFEKVMERFGRLDVLINNAGITKDALAVRMKKDDYQQVIDINLTASFYCMKLAAKYMMKQRNGSIISISSIVGLRGNPGQINYAASKAGLIGMSKTLALELASRNVRCNCIAPGFIETDMTSKLAQKSIDTLMEKIPMSRLGQASDIANAAYFLASDKASYITGQVISVDGGMNI